MSSADSNRSSYEPDSPHSADSIFSFKPASESQDESPDLRLVCGNWDVVNSSGEVTKYSTADRGSLSSKEAADVAAAARFRRRLDEMNASDSIMLQTLTQGNGGSTPNYAVASENWSGITKSRLTRTRDSQSVARKKNVTRPPPLQLHLHTKPQAVVSPDLPTRTSSRAAAQYFQMTRRREPSPREHAAVAVTKDETLKTSRATMYGSWYNNTNGIPPVPPMSVLRQASTIQSPTSTPASPLPLMTTTSVQTTVQQDDRPVGFVAIPDPSSLVIRKSPAPQSPTSLSPLENNLLDSTANFNLLPPLALPVSLIQQSANQNRSGGQGILAGDSRIVSAERLQCPELIQAPSDERRNNASTSFPVKNRPDDIVGLRTLPKILVPASEGVDDSVSTAASLRRKKSLFKWLQKRSEVDDLIDLYLDDEQLEEPKRLKAKPSKAKLNVFRSSRPTTDPPPLRSGTSI